MDFKTRKEWHNHAGNCASLPLRRYRPSSLSDLREIVTEAERAQVRVRAVGSSHSWSDVAMTPDFLVDPDGLNQVLSLDASVLKNGISTSHLVEVESGVTVRQLNEHLDRHGLALANMGGYDGQTIAGVTATSTHGSGLKFGPLTDAVRSIDLVDGTGRICRVEPHDGPTDEVKYRSKYSNERELISRDADFNAVAVGLGCFGLIYSMIVEVTDAFWLNEERKRSTWEAVRVELQQGDVLSTNDHYELLLNPYAIDGVHTCLVTTRKRTEPPSHLPSDKLRRNVLSEFLSSLFITGRILRFLFNHGPRSTPQRIDAGILGLCDDGYTNKSYKVFNIGIANNLPGLSAEYGFALDDQSYISAIEQLLNVAAEAARVGDVYQAGPIAVRFVRSCPYYLSPQFERNTVMVEIIAVTGTKGAEDMYYRYEKAAIEKCGRPHWGQLHHMSNADTVKRLYPSVEQWITVRRRFDPQGRFDAPFTHRLGL